VHVFYKLTSCHEFHGGCEPIRDKLTSCHEFHEGCEHIHDTSTSCHEFDGGSCHVHALSTSCHEFDRGYSHVHALSTSRHDLWWSFAMMIASFPTRSVRLIGLYLTCWVGSHKELCRLRPESLHSRQFRLLARSMAAVRQCSRSFPTNSIRSIGFYLTCWTHAHEERFRLHPESLHSG
jgi:hypothetical protein